VVDTAISCGINCFDTAHSYQNEDSERFLGEALSKYPRDSYYLSTKFYVEYSDDIEATFEAQLKRCQTDYFDFYMLHCLDENTITAYMDKKHDYLGYLLRQKEKGRIRNIGFSSHAAPETLKRFLDWYDQFDMALIQLNYLDWIMLEARRQYEILVEHGIPVWVMEPMKGGSLSTLNKEAAAVLKAVAPKRSLSSWGFQFLQGLSEVQVVLSGMSTVSQVMENAAIFDACNPLNNQERAALSRAAAIFMETMGVPCTSCRYCCSACPADLDIPLLIKGYNEQKISGSTWKIANLSEAKSPTTCLSCGSCVKRCPQKIDIPQVMKRFSMEMEV
jgi:predicted aldo/keto reductase-like oxidoreductase